MEVANNNIYLENPTIPLGGISVIESNNGEIRENRIEGAGTGSTGGTGLSIFESPMLMIYDCNTFTDLYIGATFRGNCLDSDFRTNTFLAPLGTGLVYRENLDISAQEHAGNRWITNGGVGGGFAQAGARHDASSIPPLIASRYEIHNNTSEYYPPSFDFPNISPFDQLFAEQTWFQIEFGTADECTPIGIAEEIEVKDPDRQIAQGHRSYG